MHSGSKLFNGSFQIPSASLPNQFQHIWVECREYPKEEVFGAIVARVIARLDSFQGQAVKIRCDYRKGERSIDAEGV